MKSASQIVFRRLTAADFYNINKPKGSEVRGGGQTYIDFPIATVSEADWQKFFTGQKTLSQKGGPYWVFRMHSLGVPETQQIELGQRRTQTFSIRRQTLGRKHSNRVLAWDPKNGFPRPKNPHDRSGAPNLVVYIIRTSSGEYWAGWFQAAKAKAGWSVDQRLLAMFNASSGNVYLTPGVAFDENDAAWPFRQGAAAGVAEAQTAEPQPALVTTLTVARNKQVGSTVVRIGRPYRQRSEDEVIEELFADDIPSDATPTQREVMVKVLKRNQRIVGALKHLYGGRCQVTGERWTFRKTDGSLYCEAHHLLALGEGGADSPYNVIVVSPLVHRMFHYADVSGLDLNNIRDDRLDIQINGQAFTITWHPRHAECVIALAK